MPRILLTTLNAKYAHASFGLRYLAANMGALAGDTKILEFDINQRPIDIVEAILNENPTIVGLGVYIWNAEESREVVSHLKRLRPNLLIILGGPEVSYETDEQEIVHLADYVITGEADVAFGELCAQLLGGLQPATKIIAAPLPEFSNSRDATRRASSSNENVLEGGRATRGVAAIDSQPRLSLRVTASPFVASSLRRSVAFPYSLYTDTDIAHRVIYVEASRGCPFKCEFCLSSLDIPVRNVPLDAFLAEMGKLLDRGVRHFKFVDRTFNLNLNIGRSILGFFLERYRPGLFLHFEMIPDRLPEGLRESIAKFPPGALQFEVGIQTFNEEVSTRISRRQDNAKVAENFRFLREETGVHIHADLIVGLPGEDLDSFAKGFDQLVAMGPQEIQVGILKRLRGTPISRHDAEWGVVWSASPPYEILQNKLLDFPAMQRLRRFSRFWDLIANSGNFLETTPLIWGERSPFAGFLKLSDWLFERVGQSHGIALNRLAHLLWDFLTADASVDPKLAAESLWADYRRGGRVDCPEFLRPYVSEKHVHRPREQTTTPLQRQARRLGEMSS